MTDYDVAVIGSGPGGYPAAIRAAQLGLSTVCIEREFLGGICLNLGCIPSKALLRNAEVLSTVRNASEYGIEVSDVTANYAVGVARSRKVVERLTKGVASLFRRDGVAYVEGNATITGPRELSVDGERIGCRNIIIATGARPALPPPLAADGEVVVTYREVIVDEQVPGRVVIVGGGATGIEFAYLYNVYGAQVTLVEFLPRILPKEDEEISQALSRALGSQGIRLLTGASVTAVAVQDGTARVTVAAADETLQLEADRVLVAAGITPNTDGLGVENAGGTLERGFIRVDDRLRVNGANVYAVGDVNGRLPLAHVAHAEGVYAAEHIGGLDPPALDYPGMPRATYCNPQVASIGLTESEAREQGYPIKVGKFPFLANGKALAVGHREGFAKIVADSSTGELLGAHLIGHEVTELLGELSMARLLDGTDVEIGRLVNVHPSMSEAVKEAALAAV
ncbi:MAG: dihydrolipoyl dehydrogenase [Chloroflexi bacterium]|nr:dihydrolipoyl dehydrogenase [Chloroflexota bacterium]MYK34318.1 dihydrolipoyl dehydrogenase [Chloroflexota bacterium]